MIELHDLTKRYGRTLAVDRLSFQVPQGVVTGFLGPNGAGKSTTMRMILDLDRPTSGRVTIDGKRYGQLSEPLKYIGALLEAKAVHPGRTARDHLLWLAQSNRIPTRRVDEVLNLVGLTPVARKRAAASRSAWASAWASPPHCSATRRSSCSTSRSTDWTRRASSGSAT